MVVLVVLAGNHRLTLLGGKPSTTDSPIWLFISLIENYLGAGDVVQ